MISKEGKVKVKLNRTLKENDVVTLVNKGKESNGVYGDLYIKVKISDLNCFDIFEASPFAIAHARPSHPGYPQPPQLLPGRSSRIAISFSSTSTLNFSLATPRRIPAKIPTTLTTAAAITTDIISIDSSLY